MTDLTTMPTVSCATDYTREVPNAHHNSCISLMTIKIVPLPPCHVPSLIASNPEPTMLKEKFTLTAPSMAKKQKWKWHLPNKLDWWFQSFSVSPWESTHATSTIPLPIFSLSPWVTPIYCHPRVIDLIKDETILGNNSNNKQPNLAMMIGIIQLDTWHELIGAKLTVGAKLLIDRSIAIHSRNIDNTWGCTLYAVVFLAPLLVVRSQVFASIHTHATSVRIDTQICMHAMSSTNKDNS